MHTCRTCLAELTPDPDVALAAAGDLLAAGHRLWRPADWEPFHRGPDCSVIRLGPDSALVVVGPEGLLEASVRSPRARAAPPLECRDVDGTTLFVLVAYHAQDHALVALDGDGRPLATFLAEGLSPHRMDVRDETSAPVARMVRAEGPGCWELMETGGPRLATLVSRDQLWDHADDHWQEVDDHWTLSTHRPLPLTPLAGVALAVAAKALFGRLEPARRRPEKPDEPWASGWHWRFG